MESKKKNKEKPPKQGRFSKKEKQYIRENFEVMTDAQLARQLHRDKKAVSSLRARLNLYKSKAGTSGRPQSPKGSRETYVSTLDDYEKKRFLLRELKSSVMYRQLAEAFANKPDYVKLYKQKYLEFMMDPSIETVTSMERDVWHEMTLAQIREIEIIKKEERESVSLSREIFQCQEVIEKCQKSLNVTRAQRLKNTSDQAINFSQVVKEIRNPMSRRVIGETAAMFKYIAERHYNDHVGDQPGDKVHILTASSKRYDLGSSFKDRKEPKDLNGDFTAKEEIEKLRDEEEKKKSEEVLHAD
jgi:hypothetical protein